MRVGVYHVRGIATREASVDEERGKIEELMRTRGFEEKEARAYYHLNEAERLFSEIEKSDGEPSSTVTYSVWIFPHFLALRNQAARWVVRRDYPEGWGIVPSDEEEEPY